MQVQSVNTTQSKLVAGVATRGTHGYSHKYTRIVVFANKTGKALNRFNENDKAAASTAWFSTVRSGNAVRSVDAAEQLADAYNAGKITFEQAGTGLFAFVPTENAIDLKSEKNWLSVEDFIQLCETKGHQYTPQ